MDQDEDREAIPLHDCTPIEENNNNIVEPEVPVSPELEALLSKLRDASERVRDMLSHNVSNWELRVVDSDLQCFVSRTHERRFRVTGVVRASAEHLVTRLKEHTREADNQVKLLQLRSHSDNVAYVEFEIQMPLSWMAPRKLECAQHVAFAEASGTYLLTLTSMGPQLSAVAGVSIRQMENDDGRAQCEVQAVWEYGWPPEGAPPWGWIQQLAHSAFWDPQRILEWARQFIQ